MKHPGSAMFLFAPISGSYSAQTSNTIDTPDGGGSFTMKSVSAASLLRRVVAASALLVAPWLLPRVHPFKFKNFQRAWILIILGMLAFGPLKAQHTTPQGPVDFGAIAQEYYRQQTGGGHGISKTSAISGKFFNGAATGNDFGISVSSAGDVNG
ncbi:MAG TPA: hypothetical protein VMM37_01315, partial [Bacteroidota bacterium]|nr:hypothetical protein [Bacteroidota bacterium]